MNSAMRRGVISDPRFLSQMASDETETEIETGTGTETETTHEHMSRPQVVEQNAFGAEQLNIFACNLSMLR